MKTTLTQLVGVWLGAVAVSVFAAPTLTLTVDPATAGPGKFAAADHQRRLHFRRTNNRRKPGKSLDD